MAAEAAEIAQARAVLAAALNQAAQDGMEPAQVRVGVAVETPSLVWQAETALRPVDFATVGTNDLLQFAFGADRDGVRMSERYDSLSPPALAMLRHLVRAAEKANTPLSVCGEMASDPLAAIALIGLGLRSLSVVPPAVKQIRELAGSIDAAEAGRLVDELIESEEHSIRNQIREFAESKGISVDDNY
ncbi:MAG: putative PEP-binding protein [Alphaproteobacteria bacterium]